MRLFNILKKLSQNAIIEYGTSGIWTYIKRANGESECWGVKQITITSWTAWGNSFEGNPSFYENYPTGLFLERPFFNATVSFSATGTSGIEIYKDASNVRTPLMYLLRPNVGNSDTFLVSMKAKGRWKQVGGVLRKLIDNAFSERRCVYV